MITTDFRRPPVPTLHSYRSLLGHAPGFVLVAALALTSFGLSQAARRGTTRAATPEQTALSQQLAAQQAATASGDPTRVTDTSRVLIATALRSLATLRAASGDKTQAVGMDRQALELDESSAGRLALAQMLTDAQQRDEARGLVAQVLAAEPRNTRALALQSSLNSLKTGSSSQTGSSGKSTAHAETLAERTREGHLRRMLAVAYNDWGAAQAKQQDYQGALALFQEGEHWDPTAPGLMRNLGMAAFRLEDFNRSASAFSAALETGAATQDSAREQLQVLLGLSQFSLQHYAPADAAFAAAEATTYSNPRAAYAWAFSLAHLSQPQRAASVLQKLMAMPLAPQERAMACQVYDQIEDYEHSVPCFQKVLAQDSTVPRTHFELAAALVHLNRPADAVPELRAELAQGDSAPEVRYYLAYALSQIQQKDEAEVLLRALIKDQPGYVEAQYLLGKMLLEKGDAKGAIEHLEVAARTTPDEPFILYQLQSAYRRDGRIADADREMQRYRELKEKTRGAPAAR